MLINFVTYKWLKPEQKKLSEIREAVEMTRKYKYDLILMDLQMPIMNGFLATKLIRSIDNINKDTPIIALTAGADSEVREQCLAGQMNDMMEKPIRVAKLAAVPEKWFSKEFQQESGILPANKDNETANNNSTSPIQVWNKDKAIEFFDNNEMIMVYWFSVNWTNPFPI